MKRFSATLALLALSMALLQSCGGGGGDGAGGASNTNPTSTVRYDGNGNTGGSVPVDATNYEQGQTVTVLGNSGNLSNSGYAFAGWNTRADGSGETYTQAQTCTMGSENITLYAIWTANPAYTVTYDGNGNTGGSVPVDTTNYEQGRTVFVLGNTGSLVRTGYTFAGWNTQADGSGTTYAQGQTFAMDSANVILYAKWTANSTYTVTYNGNGKTGGSVPIDATNYEQGQTVTVLGNTGNLVKSGYTFAGWNTQADGSGTTYVQGATFTTSSANAILYAKWTANPTHTVTYNGNGKTGGSVPIDSTNYQQGQTVTVAGNTGSLVKTDYTFSGWNTQVDGLGTTYTQGQTFAMGSANVTLYAKWSVSIKLRAVPDTGQTTCYDSSGNAIDCTNTGQDGAYTINAMSFTDNGDGTITDNVTGLVWQKCSLGQSGAGCSGTATTYTWDDAIAACNNAGLRLPTDYELMTIIDYSRYDPAIDTAYFPNTLTGASEFMGYWSSTQFASSTAYAWRVYFYLGGTRNDAKTGTRYVRCVAGPQFAPSFTDSGAGTITDNVTGLMWQKCTCGQNNDATCSGVATTKTLTDAASYCEGLSLGGFTDWRLPNIKELKSIADMTRTGPAINTDYFPNTYGLHPYWSSTSFAQSPTNAWNVSFSQGSPTAVARYSTYYVRCVRGE